MAKMEKRIIMGILNKKQFNIPYLRIGFQFIPGFKMMTFTKKPEYSVFIYIAPEYIICNGHLNLYKIYEEIINNIPTQNITKRSGYMEQYPSNIMCKLVGNLNTNHPSGLETICKYLIQYDRLDALRYLKKRYYFTYYKICPMTLFFAAKYGNLRIFGYLLNEMKSMPMQSKKPMLVYACDIAAEKGQLEIIQYANQMFNFAVCSYYGLIDALKNDYFEVVRELLLQGIRFPRTMKISLEKEKELKKYCPWYSAELVSDPSYLIRLIPYIHPIYDVPLSNVNNEVYNSYRNRFKEVISKFHYNASMYGRNH